MQKKGEFFRARAYAKAKESIITYNEPIKKVGNHTIKINPYQDLFEDIQIIVHKS